MKVKKYRLNEDETLYPSEDGNYYKIDPKVANSKKEDNKETEDKLKQEQDEKEKGLENIKNLEFHPEKLDYTYQTLNELKNTYKIIKNTKRKFNLLKIILGEWDGKNYWQTR